MNISNLTPDDVGRVVLYENGEEGTLSSWNEHYVFCCFDNVRGVACNQRDVHFKTYEQSLKGTYVPAYLLWQMLFDRYREEGCLLSNMHNILVDYDSCKEMVGNYDRAIWSCSPGDYVTEFTNVTGLDNDEIVLTYDVNYLITLTEDEFTLTRMLNNGH